MWATETLLEILQKLIKMYDKYNEFMRFLPSIFLNILHVSDNTSWHGLKDKFIYESTKYV